MSDVHPSMFFVKEETMSPTDALWEKEFLGQAARDYVGALALIVTARRSADPPRVKEFDPQDNALFARAKLGCKTGFDPKHLAGIIIRSPHPQPNVTLYEYHFDDVQADAMWGQPESIIGQADRLLDKAIKDYMGGRYPELKLRDTKFRGDLNQAAGSVLKRRMKGNLPDMEGIVGRITAVGNGLSHKLAEEMTARAPLLILSKVELK